MAFQKVVDAAEAVVEYSFNTQVFKNVLYASLAGGYDLADLTSLADVVDAAVASNWLAQQSEDLTYVKTTVRGLALENDQEVENNDGTGIGVVLTSAFPGNVSISIKKSSVLTGRSARGRLYWIGMPTSKVGANQNIVIQNYLDDVVTAVDAVRIAINVSAWTAALVSRFTAGAPRSEGKLFDWTSTSAVNTTVDSMRRRLLA